MLKNIVSSLSEVTDKYLEELNTHFEDHNAWIAESVSLTKKNFDEFVLLQFNAQNLYPI